MSFSAFTNPYLTAFYTPGKLFRLVNAIKIQPFTEIFCDVSKKFTTFAKIIHFTKHETTMRRLFFALSLTIIAVLAHAASTSFARGADISWCTEMEADGKKFYNSAGTRTDIFALMKSIGMNAIRLRVWVNPTAYGYGAWCDKADVLAKAIRANNQGLDILIDFHYSDFFADPSSQTCPVDWNGYTADQVKAAIAAHTTDVLQTLKDNGIEPKWVQVGNENNNGMVFGYGDIDWDKSGSARYANYVALSNAGYNAVKEIFPSAQVIIHMANGYDMAKYDCWFYAALKNAGLKFDMIGLSHYPDETKWDTTTSGVANNYNVVEAVKALGNKFNMQVMIVETGFSSSDFTTADAVMTDLFNRVADVSQCAGIFYWEPEVYSYWKPAYYTSLGWNAYNLGAFTSAGRPAATLNAFAAPDDGTQSSTYPATLSIYNSDGNAILATLQLTDSDNGIYSGQLNATTSWLNFQVVDTDNNVWYGTDPADKTAISTADGKYKFWIDSSVTGLYDITVNLSTMTWSFALHQDSSSSFPESLYIYATDGTSVLATLTQTDNGIYSGQLNATTSWLNFKIVDAENSVWYGSDPANAATLSAEEGCYNCWINSSVTGLYDITVNLNNMTWSHSYHDPSTGTISTLGDSQNAPVEFFDMLGHRVNPSTRGILIRRQGNHTSKILNP